MTPYDPLPLLKYEDCVYNVNYVFLINDPLHPRHEKSLLSQGNDIIYGCILIVFYDILYWNTLMCIAA